MCRSIKPLRNAEPPATEDDVREAALQYIRKVSGYRKPSRANSDAFEQAISAVSAATTQLLTRLEGPSTWT
jgi:hypothetical protein